MKKILIALLIVILIVGAFFVGTSRNSVSDFSPTTSNSDYVEVDEPEGFEKIGKNFNTIIKIEDFQIVDSLDENYVVVENNKADIGYYFEYPYASYIDIWSESNTLRHSSDIYVIKDYSSENLFNFEFIDNFTLMLKPENMDEYIIVDEVIMTNSNGSIFKGHIDCYGFDDDESDLYFFATEFKKLIELNTCEIGEPVYFYDTIFVGYDKREIYF